jgi:ComF family protein
MVLGHLINFLYPPRCAACGARFGLEEGRRVCAECLARLERLPEPLCIVCGGPLESTTSDRDVCARCLLSRPSFAHAHSIARYRATAEDEPGTLPALIRRHKYGLDQSVGRAIAEYLGADLPLHADDYDVVVPMPLHWRRLWWRGFNQATLLAGEVARRIGRPLDTASVVRRKATAAQTSRDHDERRRNVYRAFAVKHPERIAARRVLLVDDVMTTGATADACARAILAAGAQSVDVFTLARVL